MKTTETIKGKKFNVITLTYKAIALLSGQYGGHFDHEASLVPRKRAPGLSRPINLTRKVTIPKFHVSPLPQAPPNAYPTSLVGDWKFSVSVDKTKVEAGTPFTLIYKITGHGGDIKRLSLPEFKLDKFRYVRIIIILVRINNN